MNNIDIMSPWEFKNRLKQEKINEKKEEQTYSYGCLMGYFDKDVLDLHKKYVNIDDEDIYNNDENEYGLEIEPHATILYGLHDDKIEEEDVVQLINLIKMPIVAFDNITLFENEDYDVLKWDLDRDQLEIINKIVKNIFPHTESFPEYHPHSTIGYLKPGSGKKYISSIKEIIKYPITKWVYSQANGRKIAIYDDGEVEILRESEFEENNDNYSIIEYKDYSINVKKHDKFKDGYLFSVYEGENYFFGFRGPTTYNKGLQEVKEAINSKIDGKKERNK